jgi:hypothetical protein
MTKMSDMSITLMYHSMSLTVLYIKGTQENLKICPLLAVALYIQVKLYALFINWKNEAVFYRQ